MYVKEIIAVKSVVSFFVVGREFEVSAFLAAIFGVSERILYDILFIKNRSFSVDCRGVLL